MSVGLGLGVLSEPMEEEVCDVVGPRGTYAHFADSDPLTRVVLSRVAVDRDLAATA